MRKMIGMAFVLGLLPTVAQAASPLGLWSAGGGWFRVKIDQCGKVLCGKIVWVAEYAAKALSREGKPSMVGVQLLSDLRPSSDHSGQWEGRGPLRPLGGTYSVYLRPSDKQMEVEHCLLKFGSVSSRAGAKMGRAGKGILVEGSPTGEMHHPVIRLLDGQPCRRFDVAAHARVVDTRLACLKWSSNAAGHESAAAFKSQVPVAGVSSRL